MEFRGFVLLDAAVGGAAGLLAGLGVVLQARTGQVGGALGVGATGAAGLCASTGASSPSR